MFQAGYCTHQADLSGAEPGSLGFSAAALDFQMGPVDSMVFNFNSLVQKNDFYGELI